jgi:hypothetical protein
MATSNPCDFETFPTFSYKINMYHGIHDDNIMAWCILRHCNFDGLQSKMKISLLLIMFAISYKIFLLTISLFLFTHAHIFELR